MDLILILFLVTLLLLNNVGLQVRKLGRGCNLISQDFGGVSPEVGGNHTICYCYFDGYYIEYSVSYLIKLGVRIIIILKAWKKNGGTWLGHTTTYVIYFVDTSGVKLFKDIYIKTAIYLNLNMHFDDIESCTRDHMTKS